MDDAAASVAAVISQAAANQEADQPKHEDATQEGQEYTQTDQETPGAANFFDQNYNAYDFPASTAALAAASSAGVTTANPFHPYPHPQHPHLSIEALGQAAAASQHAGRIAVPGVSAPEGDGGDHSYNGANGVDHSMDMTMSSGAGDTTTASMEGAQMDRSSGKAGRTSLSVPASDGTDRKNNKDTPYSRSPDMRNSHKLAERKRRKEMKDLFDELRDEIPVDRGPKTSKWEILSKAVEHIRELRKERNDMAAEVHALRGGVEHTGEVIGGVDESGVQPPPIAEDGSNQTADEYAKYEQQQVASQQQVEAAAAAANQFTAHHDYTQPAEDHNGHQEEYKDPGVQEHTEQDWGAIAAQAAQAQAAQ